MRKRTLLYIVLLAFSFTAQFYPQKKEMVISGFVSDATTGEVLLGANILLYKDTLNLKEPSLRGTSTNSYGFYAIPKLSAGKYFFVVRYLGYKPLIREVNFDSSAGSLQNNFQMLTENINLGEVLVTGEKKEAKISTIDIPADLLTKLPSLSGEAALFKTLQLLPGVQTANELSSGLYVRGGSPDENLTLVDGMILYNPAHLGNFSSTFNSNAVQSIKLIKGAFPAEYGGRLSSVLDIRLRSGTKEKNKGTLGLGTLSSHFLLEGPLGEKATYLVSGRKMYYDAIQKEFFKNSIIPRYNFYDLNAKINYNISDSNILWIEGMLNRDNIYNPPQSNDVDYNIDWENNAISLNWLKINSKSVFLNSSISYIDYRFRSILDDKTQNSATYSYFSSSILRDLFLKTSAESHLQYNQIIKVGAELAFHNYNLIYNDFYNEILEKDPNSQHEIIASETALYFEDNWQVFPELRTNLGARFYYFNSKKYFGFEPRLSTSYLFNDNFQLNAAFAIAHQFLHLIVRNDISLPTDLWYPSSKEINPERSEQYVLGIDSYFNNKEFKFSIEGYYKQMENLYEFKNGASFNPGESINDLLIVGDGEAYGIEFFFNKQIGSFLGWVGYTLSWTKRKFDELNLGKVFYPRYDRRHDISIVIAYNLTDNFIVGATWTYASGAGYTVPTGSYQFQNIGINQSTLTQVDYTYRNAFHLRDYHKLDLNASYKFNWFDLPFEAYINIYNLYNRQNPFAFYITNNNSKDIVLKQITLFPFIPTFGINVKF